MKMRAILGWTIAAATAIAVAAIAAIYVYPDTPKSISSLKFVGYVPLPRNRGELLSVLDYLTVADRDLYVASIKPGAVYKVPLGDGRLPNASEVAVLAGPPSAHGVTFDPASGMGYVSRSEANTVDIFDPKSLRIIKRLPVPSDADGIFFDPASRLVYVASGDAKRATLIDPAQQKIVGQLVLGGKPEFAVSDPVTRLLYQNLQDVNALAVVDLVTRTVSHQFPLDHCEGPAGIALDAVGRRLFIACQKNATLIVFSIDTDSVVAAVPVGGGPDSVAYDPGLKRVYTTGRSGVVTAIQQDDPDSYHSLGSIALAFGAHTLAVDPQTHRVYVGCIGVFADPRLVVFDAKS